jgi:hypothetical protein
MSANIIQCNVLAVSDSAVIPTLDITTLDVTTIDAGDIMTNTLEVSVNITTPNIDTTTINGNPYPPATDGVNIVTETFNLNYFPVFASADTGTVANLGANPTLVYNPANKRLTTQQINLDTTHLTGSVQSHINLNTLSDALEIIGGGTLTAYDTIITNNSNVPKNTVVQNNSGGNCDIQNTNTLVSVQPSIVSISNTSVGSLDIDSSFGLTFIASLAQPLTISTTTGPLSILPSGDTGTVGQVLQTDGTGSVSWVTSSGGSVTNIGDVIYIPFDSFSFLGADPAAGINSLYTMTWAPYSGGVYYPAGLNTNGANYGTVNFTVYTTGIYRLSFWSEAQSNQGIIGVTIDSLPQNTYDLYNAVSNLMIYSVITGVGLASGTHTLTIANADKNIGSSGYWLALVGDLGFAIVRTA